MPRPNPPRAIIEEINLSQRMALERESRGWTYESLANRMTAAGCPITASSLYKSEKSGRRITFEEVVGLSRAFGIPVQDLLLPADLVRSTRALEAYRAWATATDALRRAQDEHLAAAEMLVDAVAGDERLVDTVISEHFGNDEQRLQKLRDAWAARSSDQDDLVRLLVAAESGTWVLGNGGAE